MEELMETNENSTFCVLPFIHLSTNVRGKCRLCCESFIEISKENGEKFQVGRDKIQDIWSSSHYQKVRQKMLKGEKLPECRTCYDQEKRGGISKRLRDNHTYKQYVESIQKEKLPLPQPVLLDLRFGNKCNLKCRMCHGQSSSLITDEIQRKWSRTSTYFSYYNHNLNISDQSWYLSDQFKQDLENLLPKVQQVYFSGGEPTINPEFYRFLDLCVKKNYAKNMILVVSTNFFHIKDEFFDFLKPFKKVFLCLSIDAVGDRASYIRHPSRWETVEKNILKLLPLKSNFTVEVCCTVSILNLFYLDEVFDYFISLRKKNHEEILIFLDSIYDPKHLEIGILPLKLKHLALQKIKKILKKDLFPHERKWIQSLINILFSEQENPKQLSVFKEYTLELDSLRNENFSEMFEELRELL